MKKADFGLSLKKPVFKANVKGTFLNYNWKQTKKRFKKVNPMGDLDFDGTRNKFDCKPFDPGRDGKITESIKKKFQKFGRRTSEVIKRKIKQATPKHPKSKAAAVRRVMSRFTRTDSVGTRIKRKTVTGTKGSGPGRPSGTYKPRVHPITGKMVAMPATEFYKLQKKAMTIRRADAQKIDNMAVAKLAKRGIPPEQAKQIIDRRQLMRAGVIPDENQEPVESMPTQPIENGEATQDEVQQEVREIPEGHHQMPDGSIIPNSEHRFTDRKYRVIRDIMTGRVRMVPIPQQEAWVK